MLTLRLIREEKDRVIKQLRVKNFEAEELIEK